MSTTAHGRYPMGDDTSIRLSKSLRDDLNLVVARERKRRGTPYTQADWIADKIKEDESKS
jgi:hypothetical protein